VSMTLKGEQSWLSSDARVAQLIPETLTVLYLWHYEDALRRCG